MFNPFCLHLFYCCLHLYIQWVNIMPNESTYQSQIFIKPKKVLLLFISFKGPVIKTDFIVLGGFFLLKRSEIFEQ